MRLFLTLSLLLLSGSAVRTAVRVADEDSQITVLGFKCYKSRQTATPEQQGAIAPAAAMIPANKNFERNRRINDPAGIRDPNADTIDGRSAALEKNVQDARAPKPKTVDGFAYRVKVQNTSARTVEIIFWEYQFNHATDPARSVRRQFLCVASIKPRKDKDVEAFSLFGASEVIDASGAGAQAELPHEAAIINRVEYTDGTIWQRKDWNYAAVRASIARAIATPWGAEMCRSL